MISKLLLQRSLHWLNSSLRTDVSLLHMGSFFLFGIFIAFILAGFFAGIEVGFVSLNRLAVELRKKQRSKSAGILSQFLDEPSKFIYAMNVGIVMMLVIYGLFVDKLLTPLWLQTESYLLDDPKNSSVNIKEQFLHTQFFTLVDRQGRVRGIYDGIKKDEVKQLLTDINELLAE